MRVSVRVVPRSSKNEITWDGDTLKVRLTAPPVDGAANEALITLLAGRLGLPKRALQIVQGATGRQKVLEIEGLMLAEIMQKLNK
ncbi:MAG: DUF167 domain-containing protein [Ktedonobacteraceae bacterium]